MTVAFSLQRLQGFKGNVKLSMTFIGLLGIGANLADIMFPPKCLAQDQQLPLHFCTTAVRKRHLFIQKEPNQAFKQDKVMQRCNAVFSSRNI